MKQLSEYLMEARWHGAGGMEIGSIMSIKKRPVIYTRDGNQVSLDGNQICLVKRGNNIVA